MTEGTAPVLRLRIFGLPEVVLGDRPVRLRRRVAVAVLAYLAVTGRPQPRRRLAALVAGDADPQHADRRLSNALAELRGVLGGPAGPLHPDHEWVALDPAHPLWLDVSALRAAAAAAAAGDLAAAGAAEGLYRDEFLAGLDLPDAPAFDEWLLVQREHARGTLTHALQGGLDGLVRRGATADTGDAAALARRLLILEPWREEAHRALMVLLGRAGQRQAALAQYETCRRALEAELGVAPEAQTRDLRQTLLAGPVPIPHNLPAPLDEAVGREAELERLADRLADPACRLVTLTGLGGTGKTRLALEAASRFVGEGAPVEPLFPDGVFLVPLAGAAEAAEVDGTSRPGGATPATPRGAGMAPGARVAAGARLGAAVRRALRGPGAAHGGAAAAAAAALLAQLRSRRLLLLLDGLDDDATAAAAPPAVLPALLRRAPGLTLLVTGRARLQIEGETRLVVRGLRLPTGTGDVAASPAGAYFLRAVGTRTGAPLEAGILPPA